MPQPAGVRERTDVMPERGTLLHKLYSLACQHEMLYQEIAEQDQRLAILEKKQPIAYSRFRCECLAYPHNMADYLNAHGLD